MVREVRTYAGELDEDPGRIVRSLPAAWVTFGGIAKTERYSTSRQKYIATGRFVVVVGDYNTRSEQSARQGGTVRDEVGTNLLVESVRRLLIGQDLGLEIDYFEPGRVRTLFNTGVAERAMSVFACEFDTRWVEHALEKRQMTGARCRSGYGFQPLPRYVCQTLTRIYCELVRNTAQISVVWMN
ncbi:DUF1834 family protein [Escherichia coli]|nr:DUF1834 family protein [Escherichia coli]